MSDQNQERELLEKYCECRRKVATMKEALDEASAAFDQAEERLLNLMELEGKKKTAEYAGIGFLAIEKPSVYASCAEENKPALFDYLRSIGRDDIIKETVNAKSLSSVVKENLEAGTGVPECISYYLKQTVKFYARS